MKECLIYEIEIAVRFSEMDPLGVAWHGNYFKFFEDGRDGLARHYNFDYLKMYHLGYTVPVVNCKADFKSPIYYNNKLKVITKFINTPAAKLIHEYEIWNLATNKLSAEGLTTQVFLDTKGELQLVAPDYFLEWKKSNALG